MTNIRDPKITAPKITSEEKEEVFIRPEKEWTLNFQKAILPQIPENGVTTDFDPLPDILQDLCLEYEIEPKVLYDEVEKNTEVITVGYHSSSFFSKKTTQRLHEAANDLLLGKTNKAFELLKSYPHLWTITTLGIDPHGRMVEGSLLQIAGMICDFDTVYALGKSINLSEQEISKHVNAVLFSPEARTANDERKNHVLNAFRNFTTMALQKNMDHLALIPNGLLPAILQDECKIEIDTLRKALINKDEIITCGFVFDPHILKETTELANDASDQTNMDELLFINGVGSIIWALTANDAKRVFTHNNGVQFINMDGGYGENYASNEFDYPCFFGPNSKLGLNYWIQNGLAMYSSFGFLSTIRENEKFLWEQHLINIDDAITQLQGDSLSFSRRWG